MITLRPYNEYVNRENVTHFTSPCGRFSGFDYNKSIVFNRDWDDITMTARGLVFEKSTGRILSRSLDKFFNLGELGAGIDSLPNEPWIALEKADGSMIASFFYDGQWIFMTRGSFISDQAIWANQWAHKNMNVDLMCKDKTHVFEGIYPANRIVVDYGKTEELKLIAVRDPVTGEFMSYSDMVEYANRIGCGIVKLLPFKSIDEIVEHCKTLPMTEEGYVVRFERGFMVKIKGDEYCKVHRIMSHVTPLAFWRSIDLKTFKVPVDFISNLPEEFRNDVNELVSITESIHQQELDRLIELSKQVPDFPDTAEGKKARYMFISSKYGSDTNSIVSLLRNVGDMGVRMKIHQHVRPKNNMLDGVVLSEGLMRFLSESEDG